MSGIMLQLPDVTAAVPQFAEIPPAIICCKNLMTTGSKFRAINKVRSGYNSYEGFMKMGPYLKLSH